MSDSLLDEAFSRLLVTENNNGSLEEDFDQCDTILINNFDKTRQPETDQCASIFQREEISSEDDERNCILQSSLSESIVNAGKRRSDSDPSPRTSPQPKRRKSVTFADSQGGILVQVREFDNNVDPLQAELTNISKYASEKTPEANFILLFPQPCVNYTAFMRKLFTQKVSLENAQVTANDAIVGTIKVQNLAFEKKVDVRLTTDSWQTFCDVDCKFLHSDTAYVDVFTFRFAIPCDTRSAKFCVRFRCNEQEFWDNNDGLNYCVMARQHPDDTSSGKNVLL